MLVVSPQTSKHPKEATKQFVKPKSSARPMAEPVPFQVKKTKKSVGGFGERKEEKKPSKSNFPKFNFSAGKVILVSFVVGIAGLMYLAHIFTMQQMVRDLDRMQKDYDRTRRLYEDRMLTYQRKTGPSEIYLKAKAIGLEFGGLNDHSLIVEKD